MADAFSSNPSRIREAASRWNSRPCSVRQCARRMSAILPRRKSRLTKADERIALLFDSNGRSRPVAWEDDRAIGQREQLLVNAASQLFEASVGKIGAADTAGKENVAAKDHHWIAIAPNVDDVPR